MLKSKYFISSCLVALSVGFNSCGSDNDDYIPPAIEPEIPVVEPDEPEEDDDFVPHKAGEPYTTYRGLVMTGYQGWFGTPGDGSQMTKNNNEGWYHYRENEMFRPGVLRNSIDFWPDMSEYDNKYTVGDKFENKAGEQVTFSGSPFIMPDGSYAQVFSSYDEQTVDVHFKWMKDYDIDGAFMQRFVGEVVGNAEHKDHFDTVLKHAMKASNKYQRAIAIMYDMSGKATASELSGMVKDAQELMSLYQLNNPDVQKYYLHENGKPMLTLWGVGFNDNDHPKPSVLESVVEELQAQGWAIMLGCPAYWRQGGGDCVSGGEHTKLINLIKKCDAFMPWYVGRYGYDNFKGTEWQDRIKKDIAEAKTYSTKEHKVIYSPHLYPGGSDRNMHPNNGDHTRDLTNTGDPTNIGDPTNTGFRYGGKFFWDQIYYDIKNGAQALYIGMFDEMDEGTAIFKQLEVSKVPSNVPYPAAKVPESFGYTFDNGGEDYWVNYKTNSSYSITSVETTSGVQWSKQASELNIKFQGIDDGKGSDYYLWLTGQGRKMLNKEIGMSENIPAR